MPSDLPVIVIGEGDELLIAAEAVRSLGVTPLIAMANSDAVVPFSLVRGSWIGKRNELPIPYKTPDGYDTTIDWRSWLNSLLEVDTPFMFAESYPALIALAYMMVDSEQALGSVFCGPLPLACLQNHDFASEVFWQSVHRGGPELSNATLVENNDFREYPWSHAFSWMDFLVKLYPSMKPPISGVQKRLLPVETKCNCLDGLNRLIKPIGPSAHWSSTNHHRKTMFAETRAHVQSLISDPKLF